MTTAERNAATSAAEVAAFNAKHPSPYFAYHNAGAAPLGFGRHITTWTGEVLAHVVGVGQPWASNMGDRRQAFTARTPDGVTYHGVAYLSAGDYVRMRKAASR
jgi:hypothetical protein